METGGGDREIEGPKVSVMEGVIDLCDDEEEVEEDTVMSADTSLDLKREATAEVEEARKKAKVEDVIVIV